MGIIKIEVVPHPRSPVGNFAVIRLHGIDRLAGPATFWLDPILAPEQPPPLDWLRGDLNPLAVRAGPPAANDSRTQAGSIELLIGPDIVKAAPLEPGIQVRFRMPSINVDCVLAWPDLEAAESAPAPNTSDPAEYEPAAPFEQVPDALKPASHSLVPEEAQAAGPRGLARLQPRTAARQLRQEPTEVVELTPIETIDAEPAREFQVLLAQSSPQLRPSGRYRSAEAEPAAATSVPPAPPPQPLGGSSVWLQIGLGCVIVASLLVIFLRNTSVEGSSVTLYDAVRSAALGIHLTVSPKDEPEQVLGKILEVGNVSPAGVDASVLTERQALERANKLLGSMKTPADRKEVAFWLRKALSRSLSEPRLVWAVTQLGSAYASSAKNSAPNYEAARLLWLWAANAGDAQAACFLGRLYERGLGVPPNTATARKRYEQAHRLGGCPGLEQAMLRIGKRP